MDVLTAGAKARNIYVEYCRGICKKYDINQTGLDVLLFLAANPEYNTARDICNRRGLKSGLTSVILERLIEMGLLVRTDDLWDGRVKRLALTEKAAPIIRDGQAIQKKYMDALSSGIDAEEFRNFWVMVDRLIQNIIEMEKNTMPEE